MTADEADTRAVYPVCITLRCDGRCGWCVHCRGPSGPSFAPGEHAPAIDARDPVRVRLGGGDPFAYGDLSGWVRWARARPAVSVEVEGPCASLARPEVIARLRDAAPDAVWAAVPSLDADGEAWCAGLSSLRGAGVRVGAVVPVNAVTAPSLAATVTSLAARFGEGFPVVLRRSVGAPAWAELDALGAALAEIPASVAVRVDPDRGWGACVLPRAAWRPGVLPLARAPRRGEAPVDPAACGGCALAPRCAWRLGGDPAPVARMRPLSHDDALAAHALSPDASLEHEPATARTRRDRGALSLPDIVCFAPFTTLVMCDPVNPPVPCAESWVRTEMTRAEEAASLGVTLAEVDRAHAAAHARWSAAAFVPANEDWPLDAMWNGPLARHMRRQMAQGGPSDRCRGNCRVLLGVEEPFVDVLTRPDAELTPEVVANRRLLMDELRDGRAVLRARPLELVLSVASHCNISCGFCDGPEGAYGELTERRMAEVIALLPTLMNLNVIGAGEPLMSKLFPRLLEHINDRGYPSLSVSLTTNGTLVTPRWLARHAAVRFSHIRVSLNAGSAETHARMTGRHFFDRLMENIEALAALRDREGGRFQFTLSCVLSSLVLGDLRAFAEIVDRHGANVVVEPMYGDLRGLSPYARPELLRALRDECDEVSRAFEVRNPKVSRAFRAMERFASERLRTRSLTVLPHH